MTRCPLVFARRLPSGGSLFVRRLPLGGSCGVPLIFSFFFPYNVMPYVYFDTSRYRYAIVTSTTYGTWLPGDKRGFVSRFYDNKGNVVLQNEYGTAWAADHPDLVGVAQKRLKSEPILLSQPHATIILQQWQETVEFHQWYLFVAAIMPNHFHLVLALPSDFDKSKILYRLKSYPSRALNKVYGKREWWTSSGSVRFCFDEKSLLARIEYVKKQPNPLLVWENPLPFMEPQEPPVQEPPGGNRRANCDG